MTTEQSTHIPWRTTALQDQSRKAQQADSEEHKNRQAKVEAQKEAVKNQGWRGAQKTTLSAMVDPIDGWRTFTVSKENQLRKEQERLEKMEKKAQKRAEKSARAKASWESRSRHRKADQKKILGFKTNQSDQDSVTDLMPKPPSVSKHSNQIRQVHPQSSDTNHSSHKKRQSKPRPPIDEQWIRNAGLRYLGRFSASEKHFRVILSQKINRADRCVSDDPLTHQEWIESAVKIATEYGLLDDEKLALGLANSHKRRGLARYATRQKLKQKKLSEAHIEAALETCYTFQDHHQVDPHLFAAARAARKKRIGPWGPDVLDYPTFQKQIAKLARRGFSYAIAKKVLKASLEEAESWLYDGDH